MEMMERFLDDIFKDYQNTAAAQEMRFEIKGNLCASMADWQGRGLDEQAAFRRALEEMGDIRATVAECLVSKESKAPNGILAAGMALALSLLFFGLCAALIASSDAREPMLFFAAVSPFVSIGSFALAALVYLRRRKIFTRKHLLRALAYGASLAFLAFGFCIAAFLYLSEREIGMAAAPLIPFAVPALGLFSYLHLTEPERSV